MSAPDPAPGGRVVDGVHHFPARVYYEDTDLSQLVFHARYLHFLERGRTELLRAAGFSHSALLARPDPLVLAVRRMSLEFIRAARIDDVLDVRTRLAGMRGARFEMAQEIWRGEEKLLVADLEIACLDPEGRPRRVPGELAGRMKAHAERTGRDV